MTQNHLEEDKKAACKWAYELLQRNDWCVLDTETTNLDGIAVEIAAIAPDGTVLFNSLINPDGAAIHAKARAAHKLTDEELASAPTLPEVWTQLLTALAPYKTIITYNAIFDKNILTRHAQRYKLPVLTHAWECAMERYAEYYGDWNDWHESYRWQPLNGGHRALGDAQAALKRIHEMASYHVREVKAQDRGPKVNKELRNQLGQAVYNARFMRPGMVQISWLELSELGKESYRVMGEAAAQTMLAPMMPIVESTVQALINTFPESKTIVSNAYDVLKLMVEEEVKP